MKKTVKVIGGTTAGAVAVAVAMLAGVDGKSGLEGWRDRPYQDIAGVWTDCHGNTKDVTPGFVRSKKECRDLLGKEGERIAHYILGKLRVDVPLLTLASMISFTYNIGDYGFSTSSVLRRWNAGDFVGACRAMYLWNKVTINGRKVFSQGLHNRRDVEYAMCIKGLQ